MLDALNHLFKKKNEQRREKKRMWQSLW